MRFYINQYQDIFWIDEKAFMVDYLLGTMESINIDRNTSIISEYAESCEKVEKLYQEKVDEIKKGKNTIVLIPSYRCNMECEYCYEGHIKIKSPSLKIEDIDEMISFINSLDNEETINFILLGGEPICEDNLNFFLQFFSKFDSLHRQYTISCVSNGLEISDRIEDIKKLKISSIQLTLDGLENVHNRRKVSQISDKYPFKEVCKSIELLAENNINVNVRVNIDQSNIEELPALGNYIESKKWNINDKISFYIYPITMGKEEIKKEYWSEAKILERVLELYSEYPNLEAIFELDFHGITFCNTILNDEIFIPQYKFCASCENQIVFDGNHKLYTCWWGANDDEFIIGQFENGKIEVNTNKLNKWYNHSINTIEKCKNCKYRYICGGGCVYKAFKNFGSIKEGNCAEFYEIIQMYLNYKFRKRELHNKLLNLKHRMIKNIIEENGELIVEAHGISMFPTISDKEKVLITDNKRLEVGDVILYISHMEMKLHRIISKISKDEYMVKGDNEDYNEIINQSAIIGKVKKGAVSNIYSKVYENKIDNYKIAIYIYNTEFQNILIDLDV